MKLNYPFIFVAVPVILAVAIALRPEPAHITADQFDNSLENYVMVTSEDRNLTVAERHQAIKVLKALQSARSVYDLDEAYVAMYDLMKQVEQADED